MSEINCKDLDFLIVSVPVHIIPDVVKKYLDFVGPNTLVIDWVQPKTVYVIF